MRVSLFNCEVWGIWFLVRRRIFNRPFWRLLRYLSPQVNFFASPGHVRLPLLWCPFRHPETIVLDTLSADWYTWSTIYLFPTSVLFHYWLQKLQASHTINFLPSSPCSKNTAHNRTACRSSGLVGKKVTFLCFSTILFLKQAFEVDFPNVFAWLLHVYTTNSRCPYITTHGRCSSNGSGGNTLPNSAKVSSFRSSVLSHTCNLNHPSVLVSHKHVTPSLSCMHFTSSKRIRNSLFSPGHRFFTIHLNSGSYPSLWFHYSPLHFHTFEQI